jgi:hypothetical protein
VSRDFRLSIFRQSITPKDSDYNPKVFSNFVSNSPSHSIAKFDPVSCGIAGDKVFTELTPFN